MKAAEMAHLDAYQTSCQKAEVSLRRSGLCAEFLKAAAIATVASVVLITACIGTGIYYIESQSRKIPNLTNKGKISNFAGYETSARDTFNFNFVQAAKYSKNYDYFLKGSEDFKKALENASPSSTSIEERRMAFCSKAIEYAHQIKNPYIKATALNGYVNYATVYDQEKMDESYKLSKKQMEEWLQTPQKTVQKGLGVCGDYAGLKSVMMILSGLPADDIYTLFLDPKNIIQNKNGHTVGLFRLENRQFILNNTTTDDLNKDSVNIYRMPDAYTYMIDSEFNPIFAAGMKSRMVFHLAPDPNHQKDPNGCGYSYDTPSDMEKDLKLRDQIIQMGKDLRHYALEKTKGNNVPLPSFKEKIGSSSVKKTGSKPAKSHTLKI